jgi:putative ABC transport system ATP-binding protein
LNTEQGLTIVLVTHEHDIAQYAMRTLSFRDGRVRADERVTGRRTATDDLDVLRAAVESRPASA